ncbi:MAG TPA: hypothetical protein VGL92_10825 [Acidimicrobiia bacterium]
MAMRTRKGRGIQDREREAVIGRLFEGVLRSARNHLVHAGTPLAAEVWASGLLSVWQADAASADDTEAGDGFGEALVRHARADGTPEAAATLWALAGVVPTRLATKARTAAASLEEGGIAAPPWAAEVGQARPTEAWVGSDVYGDQEIVIVGFAYGDSEHTVCVLVDHNLAGMAKDAYLAAGLPTTLARWRDAEANGITLEPITLAAAAARLEDALLATEIGGDDSAGTRLVELRALLAARLEALPSPERSGTGELDLAARDRLVAEFLSSPEAEGLLAEPAVVGICHSVVSFRADHGDGEPLRWSPTLASVCLLHHFPTHGGLDETDLPLVPDVLSAWIRFTGRQRCLPEEAIERVVAAVDACRGDFAAAMSGTLDLGVKLSVC